MKKLIYCALALAAGLFATSCMQENLEPVQEGNTVTFKVSLPEVATKAFDDGREVIDDLVYAVYRTTATTEDAAFADYENYQRVYQVNPEQKTGFTNGSTTVELELINDQNYVILFWAQNFDADVYNTTDLRNVSYAADKFNALKANEGAYAAFSGRAFIEKVKGSSVQSVTLKRPFAQINIATMDPEKYDVTVYKTAVTVSRAGAGFNVADQTAIIGEASGIPYTVEFEAAPMPQNETLTVCGLTYHSCVDNSDKTAQQKHHYVAMNYIFSAENVNVSYAIETSFGTVTNTISNVPVKPNFRTNIVGDLLTSDVKYNVTLDQTWGIPDEVSKVVKSVDELIAAVNNAAPGHTIVLGDDINFSEVRAQLQATRSNTTTAALTIPEDKNIILNLNGFDLTQQLENEGDKMIVNNGTLKIVGEGKIEAKHGNEPKPAIHNENNLTIEGGTYTALIETSDDSDLNLQGGTFEGVDASALSEFVPNGYVADEVDGKCVIVPAPYLNEAGEYEINNADQLMTFAKAVNNIDSKYMFATVKLTADIDLEGKEWIPISLFKDKNTPSQTFQGTFDGQGHKILNMDCEGVDAAGLFAYIYGATIKNVTVENATIKSNHYAAGIVAWVLNNTGNTKVPFVLDNCHVKNTTIASTPEEVNGNWDNGDKVGGLIGHANFGDATNKVNEDAVIKNCSVENTSVKAYRDFAGLLGYASCVKMNNCTTKNVTLEQDLTHDYKAPNTPTTFGMIIGRDNGGNVVDGYGYVAAGLGYDDATKTYAISTAEGLVAMSEISIKGGEKVVLTADIDLTGVTFTGLNAFNPEPNNTFDGQGHTVSNWTYTGKKDDMGFIKNWVGTIKNLTIKNAILRTGGRSAVIVAKPYAYIENCHVEDCNLQANYWACGLIAGMHNSGNMKNCTATNSYISATGGTAAITGVLNEEGGTRKYEGCVATGCTIENSGDDPYAGAAIIGLVNLSNSTVVLNDCAQSDNTFKNKAKDALVGHADDDITIKVDNKVAVSTAAQLTNAIKAGGECILLSNIAMTDAIAISNANFVLDGNGKTITMADDATNTYALFDITHGKAAFKNVTFDGVRSGAVVRTVGVEFDAENVTAQNGQHTQQQGLFRLMGKSTIKNCTFKNNTCNMVISLNYDGANNDPQVVENCVFEGNTCNKTAVLYYVKGASATINGNKFLNNTANVSNGATLYMGFMENCTITNNLFEGNTVTATSVRSSGGLMIGHSAVVRGNAFVNNTLTVKGETGYGNDVCASPYYAAIDLSGNYWGGSAPVENVDYYKEYNNYEVIINDYLTENPIK